MSFPVSISMLTKYEKNALKHLGYVKRKVSLTGGKPRVYTLLAIPEEHGGIMTYAWFMRNGTPIAIPEDGKATPVSGDFLVSYGRRNVPGGKQVMATLHRISPEYK